MGLVAHLDRLLKRGLPGSRDLAARRCATSLYVGAPDSFRGDYARVSPISQTRAIRQRPKVFVIERVPAKSVPHPDVSRGVRTVRRFWAGAREPEEIEAVSHRMEERLPSLEAVEPWSSMHVRSLIAPFARWRSPRRERPCIAPWGGDTKQAETPRAHVRPPRTDRALGFLPSEPRNGKLRPAKRSCAPRPVRTWIQSP